MLTRLARARELVAGLRNRAGAGAPIAGIIRAVKRMEFAVPPAQVRIGDGLAVATRYWSASVERWVLPVVAVALASGLATWLFTDSLSDRGTLDRLVRLSVSGTPL